MMLKRMAPPSVLSSSPAGRHRRTLIHTVGVPNAEHPGVEAAADSRGDVAAHGFLARTGWLF
jgi:hypothetical protein